MDPFKTRGLWKNLLQKNKSLKSLVAKNPTTADLNEPSSQTCKKVSFNVRDDKGQTKEVDQKHVN